MFVKCGMFCISFVSLNQTRWVLKPSATPFPTCWPCEGLAPTWATRRRHCSPGWRRQLAADEETNRKWPWFPFAADAADRQAQPVSQVYQTNLNMTMPKNASSFFINAWKNDLHQWFVSLGSQRTPKQIKMQFGDPNTTTIKVLATQNELRQHKATHDPDVSLDFLNSRFMKWLF